MYKRYQGENLFRTTLSDSVDPISAPNGTNDLDVFEVKVFNAPSGTKGWIMIDFTDDTKRDLIYYHSRTGTTLYYYRKDRDLLGNGAYAKQHEENAYVQINDVSQWIDYLFANVDDFGRVEDMGGNKARILGGDVDYGSGTVVTVSDLSPTTLADGTWSAIFDTGDGALKFTQSYSHATHILLATVVVASSDISSITDKRYTQVIKNKEVIDQLGDSGGALTYKGVPIAGGGTTVEKWVVVEETTGIYTANLGEYIRCKHTADHTIINLPQSNNTNEGNKVAVAKKNSSGKYIKITPYSGGSIEGFTGTSLLQIGQQNTCVVLVSNGDGSRSIE